ncbi:hypothetical protein KR009_003756, partial [Drosophila setifemur]
DIKAHDGRVTSLDLGETGRVLVTGGEDRNVNLWAIGQNECFMSLTGHNRSIDCVRFAYKDNFVYSADDIGIIRRWDLNAQKIYSTLNGHMKSVRTLDFNPSGEYVVSGSNDTTVRLWDVQNENNCIKICRGHISHVNSVKFSPDGLWIASAGLEGSILIWDIRKSKQIMEFIADPPAKAITCIQFHPFEFLLAAGRVDGTVCIYDLEHQQLVSQTTPFYGQAAIKSITFSDDGECMFVGSSSGIAVIGWEPDRELDHIKSTWSSLGDMKVVNNKLICGCHEDDCVSVNTVSLDRVIPFYQPANALPNFKHNSTNRKSFTRGNQKFRLSLGGSKPAQVREEQEDNKGPGYDELSSPNLSLEVVNEAALESGETSQMSSLPSVPSSDLGHTHLYETSLRHGKLSQPFGNPDRGYGGGYGIAVGAASRLHSMGNMPSSLHTPTDDYGLYSLGKDSDPEAELDVPPVEFNLNESNPPILSNYEMAEDFPVNQNLNYIANSYKPAPAASTINASSKSIKKTTSNLHKRTTGSMVSSKQTSTGIFGASKLSQVSSVSSMELHKLDDNMVLKKSSSSNVVNKNKRPIGSTQSQFYKENGQQKNINVEIFTKPPTRSRTTLDMRTSHQNKNQEKQVNPPLNNRVMDDQYDIDMLTRSHEAVLQELSNRQTSLDLLRNSTRSHDVLGALKQAKNTGRSIFIDLLGAILEKPSSWNLDFCIFVLPEIYELLQSQHKFHFTRACDTLRIILSNFLPTIQENLDSWAANGLGVDVTREDRQRKCAECQRWLLQIKNLPESVHFGSSLSQLQNIIIF